ncbi:MAG TPA: methyltransferase domain-containing protein [Gemmatimonadaceae bacterium]|nr:methyltransferase domain-containing protein [Gemmatimonadaceae bacterium]
MSVRRAFWRKVRQLRRRLTGIPDTGRVDFGELRRLEPLGRHFGEDRGLALDRHYIEAFLHAHQSDIRGRVLEIGEDRYTRQFGGDRVTGNEILHVTAENPRATIVGDLADAPHIPDAAFDTLIVTQTLHLIYDAKAAARTMHRVLRPGGVLLLTVPGITQIPNGTPWAHTWFWAFTPLSVRRMLGDAFAGGTVEVSQYGNVLAAAAMLYGLASADLRPDELAAMDPDYPVIIGARAERGA